MCIEISNFQTPNSFTMKLTFTFIALFSFSLLHAQKAGTLDSSFGDSGKVISKYFGDCHFMVLQKDNKILCGGTLSQIGFRLVRYLNNGTVDSTFGKQGIADIAIAETFSEMDALKLQDDQKIIIGGWGYKHGVPTFVIARCLQDGSLDASFGTNGIADTTFGIGESTVALGLQPDGKIIVTGWYAPTNYITVRYNNDGSIDENFGNNGTVFTNFGVFVIPSSIAIQPDNKIVVGGSTSQPAKFLLVRYMPDGSLDNSFGNNGKTFTDFGPGDDVLNAAALQPDGKIVVSGVSNYDGLDNMALARYLANGQLDNSFNDSGKVTCKFKGLYSQATAILIQPDNKLIISGITFNDANDNYFGSARYLTDGTPDSSYGLNSQVLTSIDSIQLCYASGLQNDGKIILAGTTINSDYSDNYALIRYNNDLSQKQIIITKIRHYLQTHNAQATTLSAVSVYPNPAQNVLHVTGLSSNAKLTVVDFIGNIVVSSELRAVSGVYDLNIASLHAGKYLLKIETNSAIVTKRFVKQ
jgi:uncharacterized delta-60 repeat protein